MTIKTVAHIEEAPDEFFDSCGAGWSRCEAILIVVDRLDGSVRYPVTCAVMGKVIVVSLIPKPYQVSFPGCTSAAVYMSGGACGSSYPTYRSMVVTNLNPRLPACGPTPHSEGRSRRHLG